MTDATGTSPSNHPSFPQPPDQSVLVWRYMDMPKLVSMLARRELHLARLDLLPDKYEGTLTRPTRSLMLSALASAAPFGAGLDVQKAEQITEHWLDATRKMRRTMYASCWRMGNHESEAMWRLYCGSSQGVAVVLPYSRLCEWARQHDAYVGAVRYIDYETEVIDSGNTFNAVMHKRREFEHEQEARVVRWHWVQPQTKAPPSDAEQPPSTAIPWDPEQLIEKLFVSPYAPAWYLDSVQLLVERIAPELRVRVAMSLMSAGPYL